MSTSKQFLQKKNPPYCAMNPLNSGDQDVTNTTWNNCHIDIWFVVARYLRPEDTLVLAQICKKTFFVTNSESFWKSIFNRYIRSKYPWLDIPTSTVGSSEFRIYHVKHKHVTKLCNRFQIFETRQSESFSRPIRNSAGESSTPTATTTRLTKFALT